MGAAWSSLSWSQADPQQPDSTKPSASSTPSAARNIPSKTPGRAINKVQSGRVTKATASQKTGNPAKMAQTRKSRAKAATPSNGVDDQDAKDASQVSKASDGQQDTKGDDEDATTSSQPAADAGPTTSKPFKGCAIALSGNMVSVGHNMTSMRKLIRDLGGMTPSSITKSTTHIICTSNEIGRRQSDSVDMNIPAIKPEWIVDCEEKKRRLPEADYLWDFSCTVAGQQVTSADVLARAIANGLIISPANDSAPAATSKAPKAGKRARKDSQDAEVKDQDEDEAKPKAKKTKTAAKATKGKAAAKKEPSPAPAAAAPSGEDAEDGDLAEGQFAKKKDMAIPIDEFCPLQGYQVYIDNDSGMIYDASLNQSNASHNNNKFYRDQVSSQSSSRSHLI
jgi:hypothetical protein